MSARIRRQVVAPFVPSAQQVEAIACNTAPRPAAGAQFAVALGHPSAAAAPCSSPDCAQPTTGRDQHGHPLPRLTCQLVLSPLVLPRCFTFLRSLSWLAASGRGSSGQPTALASLSWRCTELRALTDPARSIARTLACLLLSLWLGLGVAAPAQALLQASPGETGTGLVRSLESLRDLDYESWQVVAYREGPAAETAPVTLRIVGYPGRVRLDHPTPLLVRSGRRLWELADTTLANPKLAGDVRAAAAEFDLTPLLADLRKNRPLRLELPGVFVELPVPPYVVEEWRALPSQPLL